MICRRNKTKFFEENFNTSSYKIIVLLVGYIYMVLIELFYKLQKPSGAINCWTNCICLQHIQVPNRYERPDHV